MRTRKRQWAALLSVPLLIGLAMWPMTQRHRERARVQEATQALQTERKNAFRSGRTIQVNIVRQLLSRGANVNVRVRDNSTMLHDIAWEQRGWERNQVATMLLLLAHKATINARNSQGFTPLMAAVFMGRPGIVQLLLDHGAQVNLRETTHHRTAMLIAKEELQNLWNINSLPRSEQAFYDMHAIAHGLHNAYRIIAMLKAAGAHE